MSFLLTDLMQAAYRRLGQLNVTPATGGSTTTVVDTKLLGRHKNNELKNGVVFIIRTTDGLAPQGEFRRISAYDNTTTTMTVDTAFSVTVGAGDTVGYAGEDYPFHLMVEWANDALRTLGDIVYIDTTSLVILNNTTEYSLPAAWKDVKPWRIDIQGFPSQSGNNDWQTIPTGQWEFIPPATTAAQAKIILPFGEPLGNALRVWYRTKHPTITAYSDVISDSIDPELAVISLVVEALNWYNLSQAGGDQYAIEQLNKFTAMKDAQLAKTPVERPKKMTRTLAPLGLRVVVPPDTSPGPP